MKIGIAVLAIGLLSVLTIESSSGFALRNNINKPVKNYNSISATASKRMSSMRSSNIEEVAGMAGKQGKKPLPGMTSLQVAGLVALGVPYLSVVIPLGAICQLVNYARIALLKGGGEKVLPGPSETATEEAIALDKRKYDLVLLGATGFVGELATKYLVRQYGVNNDVKWAIAGRSTSKLETLKDNIAKELADPSALSIPTIIADTSDENTLLGLVKDTRCIASTAGPFTLYGSPVVHHCAKYGTHYVDITGEVDWVKQMIYKHHSTAYDTGAKIISCCGHDSVPWDLTVHMLHTTLQNQCDDTLVQAECFHDVNAGGASGGTLATVMHMIETGELLHPPRMAYDPWLQLPNGVQSTLQTVNKCDAVPTKCPYDIPTYRSNQWLTFSFMAPCNYEVVKRSNAIRRITNDEPNDDDLIYREAILVPDFNTAFSYAFGILAFLSSLLNPLTRTFLKYLVLPKPGQGPSLAAMQNGYLTVFGFGKGKKGNKVQSVLYFPKEPGYMDTARMLVESGLCLALDSGKLPVKTGGFFTPSTAMGTALLDRLCKTGSSYAAKVVIENK